MMKAPIRILAAVLLYLLAVPSFAQNSQPVPVSAPGQGLLTGPQLEALISPIALYPDALLSEILMASTYPLEVVTADRWVKSNTNLQGDQLKAAVEQQSWDQSVKSLAATPDVLDMMSSKLDWTQKLGDAVLAQQPDVMDAIQRLRQRAQSKGKLVNTAQQTVTKQVQGDKQVIAIEPTQPDTLYVPYYDPAVVYGEWPYPEYPPYEFGYPGWIGPGIIATGLAFGGAYALGRWAFNGSRWGGGLNWGNNQINPLRSVNNINVGNNNWVHNPAHRQGQRYNNANVAQRFGGNRNNAAQNRGNFRGSNGQQVLNPGGNRPGAGNKTARPGSGNAAGGNRPGAGNKAAKSPGAGNKAAKNRPSQHAGNRTTNRGSANRTASNRTNTGNRSSAHRSTANRSTARHTASRGRGTPGRGTFASAGGGRSMGGMRAGGGGGMRAGGGGRGGGRRSDLRLKHDIVEVAHLASGIGLYRFVYNGGHRAYVGVIAQEVQNVMPAAVTRGADGYLRVRYEKLGLKFQTYRDWLQSERSSRSVGSAR